MFASIMTYHVCPWHWHDYFCSSCFFLPALRESLIELDGLAVGCMRIQRIPVSAGRTSTTTSTRWRRRTRRLRRQSGEQSSGALGLEGAVCCLDLRPLALDLGFWNLAFGPNGVGQNEATRRPQVLVLGSIYQGFILGLPYV